MEIETRRDSIDQLHMYTSNRSFEGGHQGITAVLGTRTENISKKLLLYILFENMGTKY